MTHGKALSLVDARLDLDQGSASLEPAELARLEAHLAECDGCAAAHARYARVVAAVRRLPRRRAPVGFTSAVMARVRREPRLLETTRQGIVLFSRLRIPHAAVTALLLVGCAVELVALASS